MSNAKRYLVLIPLVIALEPASAMFGASIVGKSISTFDKIFYVGIFIAIFFIMNRNNSYPDIFIDGSIQYKKRKSGDNIYLWILLLLLIYPFVKYAEINLFYLLSMAIVAFALIMSLNKKSPGSVWCLYGNAVAILFLFYPYLIKKIEK